MDRTMKYFLILYIMVAIAIVMLAWNLVEYVNTTRLVNRALDGGNVCALCETLYK